MNTEGFLVLLMPVIGLYAICRGGRWHWDPISSNGVAWIQSRFVHRLLLGMFWVGWTTGLVIGVLMLFGV